MAPPALPRSPAAGLTYTPIVMALLRRSNSTCLVRSLVLQQWYADHGDEIDVIVGVTAPSGGFKAHAWLDIPGTAAGEGFHEMRRIQCKTR